MRIIQRAKNRIEAHIYSLTSFVTGIILSFIYPVASYAVSNTVRVNESALGFEIPSFADILTFLIKAFFVAAGVFALLYLLLGAFSWVTSGGNKENVEKARDKIQAAIVGVILIVVVVALVATLEQIVFRQALCLGLTCNITIPALLNPK